MSNPTYFQADPTTNPYLLLENWYSKSDIKRLRKQKGIRYAYEDKMYVWIKVGKQFYIIGKDTHFIARQAMVWWEYHFQLKPKELEWRL